MWKNFIDFLTSNPSIAIFVCLGFGYLIGRIHFKSFTVGSTVGVLIMGLLVGQITNFDIPDIVKNIFFDLFIFTIGYEVGPAFVRSFKKNGIRLMIDGVFFSVIAFIFALILFKIFHVGRGEGAGIIAGALTQSAVIGTSASSINTLNISHAAKVMMNSQVAIAYAITYVFGTAGVIIFIKDIAPKILRVDLKEETKNVIKKLHYVGDSNKNNFKNNPIVVRAFKVASDAKIANWTVNKFEKKYQNQIVIEKIIDSQNKEIKFNNKTIIKPDMIISLVGNVDNFINSKEYAGTEVFDDTYRKVNMTKKDIRLTNVFNISALRDLVQKGIVITQALDETDKKFTDFSKLKKGDKISVLGPEKSIDNVIDDLGYACDEGTVTDVSFLSIGIIIGILIGSIIITIKDVPLTLGAGGGALFAGLFFGWWQDKNPKIGNIPSSVRWLLKSLGLNLFIGCVGLSAGSAFVPALKQMGWGVLLIGAVVSIFPFLATLLFGKYILKLNAVDNIGGLCGSGTITAALNAVTEQEKSSVFALSYTPTYAIGNILITVMGPLIIALL
nr:aspartate-alanine antiporter [uncultured Ligilactobacillus sp.]